MRRDNQVSSIDSEDAYGQMPSQKSKFFGFERCVDKRVDDFTFQKLAQEVERYEKRLRKTNAFLLRPSMKEDPRKRDSRFQIGSESYTPVPSLCVQKSLSFSKTSFPQQKRESSFAPSSSYQSNDPMGLSSNAKALYYKFPVAGRGISLNKQISRRHQSYLLHSYKH